MQVLCVILLTTGAYSNVQCFEHPEHLVTVGDKFDNHVVVISSLLINRTCMLPMFNNLPPFLAVIAMYNHLHLLGSLPSWVPAPPKIAIECLGVTSFALSLLLVSV